MAGDESPWPLHLLSLLFSLLSSLHTRSISPSSEAAALLLFRSSLSPPSALRDWLAGTTPCGGPAARWSGVTCSGNGTVEELRLDNMHLSGRLPSLAPLAALPALRAVSVSNNALSGPLPTDIQKLRDLAELDLSYNRFSGGMPEDAFAGLRMLQRVDLSHNDLDGSMPESLAELPQLAELSAEYNRFQGELPDIRQPGLRAVNVAYNNLEGPIPTGLSKFNASIFEGNKNLCGPPLSIPCSSYSPPSPSQSMSPILLFAIIVISLGVLLIIIGLIMIILARRRQKNKHTNQIFQHASATESSDADDEAELGVISRHHGGHKRSHKEENGKLVFVRDREQRFEIEDLLRASAEILGSGNFGSSYKASLFDGPAGNYGSNLQPLDWPTRLKVIKGVAKGLLYLHEELPALTVPHGHLKSSNVLLNESYEPVLSDYGLVPVMSHSHASQVMVAYKSPEFAKYGKLSRKSDVWSFGILILEILTGNFPTIYLKNGNSGSDSAMWISLIVREVCTDKVFDAEMLKGNEDATEEMMKLLNIGLSCCEEDLHKRLDLKEATKRIEDVRETVIDNDYF